MHGRTTIRSNPTASSRTRMPPKSSKNQVLTEPNIGWLWEYVLAEKAQCFPDGRRAIAEHEAPAGEIVLRDDAKGQVGPAILAELPAADTSSRIARWPSGRNGTRRPCAPARPSPSGAPPLAQGHNATQRPGMPACRCQSGLCRRDRTCGEMPHGSDGPTRSICRRRPAGWPDGPTRRPSARDRSSRPWPSGQPASGRCSRDRRCTRQ